MVEYKCPRCGYITLLKGDIKRHYNRKKVCNTKYSRISIKDCLKELSIKKKKLVIDEESFKQMKEEIRELKDKLEHTQVSNTINSHNTNNDNSITNNIHININDFKNTNYEVALEDLKESIRNSLLKNDGECNNIECNQLVELVHCNDKYPENQNVLITDCSRGEARIKEGGRFIKVPMIDAVDDIVTNIVNLLKENNVFKRYVKVYERNYRDDSLKEIRDTLYNNREKIKDTAKSNGVKL